MVYLFIGLLISFCVLLCVGIFRQARQLRNYELFFEDTLEDIEHAHNMFYDLVHKRELLINDPDVKKLQQVSAIMVDILSEYGSYGKKYIAKKENKK